MCDLICNVISCCVWSCEAGKLMNMIKSWLKVRKEKMWK